MPLVSTCHDSLTICGPNDIVIAVVGLTGAGKSTLISQCTGQNVEIGHDLDACTTLVEPFMFERNGHTVHLIDTPGFDGSTTSDALLLEDIAACLNQAYTHGVQVSGIIYLHAINSPRAQGSAKKALRIVKKICGEDAYPVILLGSTMWNKEDFGVAKRREEELINNRELWGDMIAAGSKSFKFYNDRASALVACDYIIQQGQKKTLALQHQMVNEHKSLNETEAGIEMHGEVLGLQALCKSNLAEARREARRAARLKNQELASALDASKEDLRLQLYNSEKALTMMYGDVEALHARSEAALKEELERLESNRERDEQERRKTMSEMSRLEDRLRDQGVEIGSASSPRTASGEIPQNPEEAARLLQKYNDCKRELDLCQKRKNINKHRMDTCLSRVGVGAGVVGTAFQIAAVGMTAAACTIM
ncbi:putative G domain-containing protein [Seiridium cardinale]|uniref:G domain-containing protein n=1 Tax=Seiridium cardinale TaxID=138064 RepID=A0ABR2XMM4_9PEZI